MTTAKPYGLWPSNLSARAMAGDLGLKDVAWAADGTLIWLESRDGHAVLVARGDGNCTDGSATDAAARDITRELRVSGGVGYGGGDFCAAGGDVFFAASDGRLYRSSISRGQPQALTPPHGGVAAPCVSPDGHWVVYVHTDNETDVLAAVDSEGNHWPQKLVSGADFYMQPTWSPDGKRIAWISWNHPNMPWDETELHLGEVAVESSGLALSSSIRIAPDENAAMMQPEFSPDGKTLAFLCDCDGWWQLYLYDLDSGEQRQLTEGAFEIGGPAWVQGTRAYVWKPDGSGLYAIRNQRGKMDLLDVGLNGACRPVDAFKDYSHLAQPAISKTGALALLASSSRIPTRVVSWKSRTNSRPCIERHSAGERLRPNELAEMRPVSWPSEEASAQIHGNYYPPTNPDYRSEGKPPAIVVIHGGPTSQNTASYSAASQFFATRGFAVLEVNYRGSTGYGRDYRHALKGNWGVYDVEDAKTGAQYLADSGLADPDRVVIMGGSAGGYTVLQSLVENPGVFAAGICKYGISNLFALSMETHKFESRYNDALVGVLPDDADTFRARSPLFHAERIQDPVAIFQGGEDKVVPPNQAEMMVDVLEQRGVPHEYHLYEEEGHGWRRAETIEQFYEAALAFLKQYVIFS
jgi:dipeptidyl aminopeptidase/acylaminoacyl peptidase